MIPPAAETRDPASFRDPSGLLYWESGRLLRRIYASYIPHYEFLLSSGLYESLVADNLLIPHTELPPGSSRSGGSHRILQPELVPFISYPFEWCFGQLRDAAFLTLSIQRKALKFGMWLKDASAYNIQFQRGRPILIDTLSFEKSQADAPWVAYAQFCRHFLAPLALMSYKDPRLGQMLRLYPDGIPLDLASRLLPSRAKLNPCLLAHIFLHAKFQQKYSETSAQKPARRFSLAAMEALIDNLEGCVRSLKSPADKTEWSDYYAETNYTPESAEHKKSLIAEFLENVHPQTVWDLGGNVGLYSRVAAQKGANVICLDSDHFAVHLNYEECRKSGVQNVLPLVMDLTNPSSGMGWAGTERKSLEDRGPADCVMALALVHHLAISNNVPLALLADYFSRLGKALIVEFIPKEDTQVKRLLSSRKDIFPNYAVPGFEEAFKTRFVLNRRVPIAGSLRTLYLMERL